MKNTTDGCGEPTSPHEAGVCAMLHALKALRGVREDADLESVKMVAERDPSFKMPTVAHLSRLRAL